ncbi:MAG TPA: cupin domain-containing protein [Lentimicrobium sp.]|jgi:quercetin dioxygenase-like cupin family protein|nr:cupin domain-containing protein [Lentimicrobium sp.]
MKIVRLHEAPKVPFDLDGHRIAESSCAEIIHLCLKAGEKLEKHINPVDVCFYVLEGKALFITDTERILVQKDHCIQIEGGINRGFDNISLSDFKVLVIKFRK